MRIQHNIMAKNSYRHYVGNRSALGKNLEKLSSGYKINRAGDDAAGLAISEKMRAQITALDAAQDNVKKGINLIQTAEGAMQEIHDMLQRMGELATRSANGTYDDDVDRQALQDEVDALLEEIERIKDTTDFNGVPLLLGEDDTTGVVIMGGLPSWVSQPQLQDGSMTGKYNTNHAAAYVDFSGLNAGNVDDLLKNNRGFCTTCCTCDRHYSIQFVKGAGSSMTQSGDHYIYQIGIDGVTTGADLVQRIIAGTGGRPNNHFTQLTFDPSKPGELIIYDNRAGQQPNPTSGRGIYEEGVAYMPPAWTDLALQIGETATDADRLVVKLPNMTLKAIGIAGLFVDSVEDALEAMDLVKKGVNYVSSERARMGAYQNRLEHTLNNLNIMEENVQAAESNIRDTDIAEEMMAYTKNNILIQSAQAMLAQANQVPQGVLQLMQ